MMRLHGLVDAALENLRHSLGQKVLMLDASDEAVAAGTTKHCLSCFKDRSQSPVRGRIGLSPALQHRVRSFKCWSASHSGPFKRGMHNLQGSDGHVYHHAEENRVVKESEEADAQERPTSAKRLSRSVAT